MMSRWIVVIVFVLFSTATFSMRCKAQLVYEGDTRYDVKRKCGEPLDKVITEESVPLYDYWGYLIGTTTRIVEIWIYQRSPADFRYEVYFDDGQVKEINAKRAP